ncbi:MAG TPA: hypothetical protein PKZ76_14880 [Xanthomonadaceae bacterium]|nr:hypothetical protein [Xanthomonadaceae bacterium]
MKQISVFCGALLLGASLVAHAGDKSLRLSAAQSGDLVPSALFSAKGHGIDLNPSRDAVTFSWAIEEGVDVDFAPEPFRAESREFWTSVEAGQFQRGVDIVTTAPSAVIRISPVGERAEAVDLDGLQVIRQGRSMGRDEAVQNLADADQLRHAGAPFPDGTAAFRLSREAGAGAMRLVLPRTRGATLLHVFEPDSSHLMHLGAERDVVVSGNELRLHGQFRAEGVGRAPSVVQGIVTAPGGRTWPVSFLIGRNGDFEGTLRVDGMAGGGPGLWEAHVFAALPGSEGDVLRDSRTAFAVSVPTARLSGAITHQDAGRDGGLAFDLGVETALAARYEVRGILVGTDRDGQPVAVAVGNSAAWLEAGDRSLPLVFSAESIRRDDIGAPYQIRDLRLIRQGDMDLQERRNLAFAIDRL